MALVRLDNPIFAVFLIALGMALVPLNDASVALLDQGSVGRDPMPIMQIIAGRAGIGLIALVFLPGAIAGTFALGAVAWAKLMFRGAILVGSMLTYFLGLTIFQLWEMSAIFFVCPVIISVLSVPLLGERLGFWRVSAVLIGFSGVIVIVLSSLGMGVQLVDEGLLFTPPNFEDGLTDLGWTLFFPIGSAVFYALYQIITRMMRNDADALVMTVVQIFAYFFFGIVIGLTLWLLPIEYEVGGPAEFLLRDWIMPGWEHWGFMVLASAIVLFLSFAAANAYRVAEAAYVAPFEYSAVPLSIIWGGIIWGEWPAFFGYVGTVMIIGAGLLIIFRERARDVDVVTSMPMTRSSAFSVAAVDEREPIWVSEDDHLV